MGAEGFNFSAWLATMVILIVAITIHEFAHALAADRLGDPTPRSQGRISLNPIDHLDPLGTLMMAVSTYTGMGIGWGRPVQFRPDLLKHPRRDTILIAIAGPLSNLLQAAVFAGLLRLGVQHGWIQTQPMGYGLLYLGVLINVSLVLFNLIPIPPLDGSKVVAGLLPAAQARVYSDVMGRWGMLLFLVLVFTPLPGRLIGPPVNAISQFLIG